MLDTIVPPDIIMEIKPAPAIGNDKSERIVGQAAPNIESGRPKLIKAI
jgi:hypothetical protein